VPQEFRFDAGRLGKASRTPQGGARVPAALTRTGILEYRRADGSIRREYRPADEVFRADSLGGLRGASVTTDKHQMVTPANYRELTVGHVIGEPRADGDKVVAELDINDARTLERIDAGELQEISSGYVVNYDPTPGVYNGVRYDGVQREIQYNHVLLLPKGGGRAGRDVGLRLDSNSAVCDTGEVLTVSADKDQDVSDAQKKIVVIRLDGVGEVERGSDAHIAYLENQTKTAVAAEKTRADKAEARADAAELALKQAQEKLTAAENPARLDALVQSRLDVRTKASRVLGSEYKFDGKSDREIMIDCVRVDAKDFDGKGKSDEYVSARFDAVVVKDVRADSIAALPDFMLELEGGSARGDSNDSREDAEDEDDADVAELKMLEANRNGWRKAK
jgi:uncharacterized protein